MKIQSNALLTRRLSRFPVLRLLCGCTTVLFILTSLRVMAWDFTHSYQTVYASNALDYVIEQTNIMRYSEGFITYWKPKVNDLEASLTKKFAFPQNAVWGYLQMDYIYVANFNTNQFGSGSLWGSKDGTNWIQLLDAPRPSAIASRNIYATTLPSSLMGGTELWLQSRLLSRGMTTMAQFLRYDTHQRTNNTFELKVSYRAQPPTITSQPTNAVVIEGGNVTFSVAATAVGSLSYQWLREGVNIEGATNRSLTLSVARTSDAGGYSVVVDSAGGSVVSSVASLYVIHRATASPILAFGFVVGGTITGGGYGYTNIPLVQIIGGGGSGAVALAIVSNGVVTGITMLNAGFGYTSTPQMIVQPPFIPTPSLAVSPMTELTSSELAPGGNYQLQRGVVGFWTNEMPSFQATSSTLTQLVAGIAGTATYRLVLSPTPSQAFATPQMVNGFVVGVSINAGGSGYVTTPRVVIYGGGGTNATAVASLTGGVVTGIAITSAGISYTSAPSIRIDPPPAASVTPQQTQVLRLKSANLSPYDNYRFESTPGIGVGWTPIGNVVVPTESTNTTDLAVTNSAGLFRLRYTP